MLDFDHHQLTKTHRNDGGILEVVNNAGAGVLANPQQIRSDVKFITTLPDPNPNSVHEVLTEFDQALAAVNGDFASVGLMVPRRKGDANTPGWNVTYLNAVMRERYNGSGQKIAGTIFRVGDRVIIRKNQTIDQPDNEVGFPQDPEFVVNGDTAFIRDFEMKSKVDVNADDSSVGTLKSLTLELDDERIIHYPANALDALSHAYAITVHAAQGSQYRQVICLCVNGSANFIHRAIYFTAFSRAQQRLVIIGQEEVIRSTIRRLPPPRHTYLVERVGSAYVPRQKPAWEAG
jgi:exodeoxyribonuclease V alpha subunit